MKKSEPVIVEQTYNASIDKVWNAITDRDQMREWFFDTIDSFKPEVGFETQFNVRANDKDYLHLWKVTDVVAGKKITFNWKYPDYPGDSYVTVELSSKNNLTILKLTHEGIESFPRDNPDFSRESCSKGWDFLIRKSLKEFLDKNKK